MSDTHTGCFVFPRYRRRLFSLLLLSLLGIVGAAEDKRPNIILIMADDLGTRAFQECATPALDKMGCEGMVFDFAHATPLCTPTRVQIMTGVYNFRNYTQFAELKAGETTFAHILKSAGYRNCIVGKWQLGGNVYAPYGFGFDDYCLWQLTFAGYGERYHNPRLIRNGKMEKYELGEFGPRLFVEHLKGFVRANRDQPFFVYYPMALPHRPNVPTPDSPEYGDRFGDERENLGSEPQFFDDQVRYLDKLVGDILSFLDAEGLGEKTLVLFTTDNGTSHEIEVPYQDRRIPGQKGQTNLLATHVPLIARWPGKVLPGLNRRIVDFTDILPTLAEAAGAEIHGSLTLDGLSFYPQLMGKQGRERDWIFCDYNPRKNNFAPARFIHDREWKLYDTGDVFHIAEDPVEERPLSIGDLPDPIRKRIDHFRDILSQLK